MNLLAKPIVFAGHNVVLCCDGRCDLAWGIQGRPRTALSKDDPDDFVYLGDDDPSLGTPPSLENCGSEGGDYKPSDVQLTTGSEKMNRWCARECERAKLVEPKLNNLCVPLPNKVLRKTSHVWHTPSIDTTNQKEYRLK